VLRAHSRLHRLRRVDLLLRPSIVGILSIALGIARTFASVASSAATTVVAVAAAITSTRVRRRALLRAVLRLRAAIAVPRERLAGQRRSAVPTHKRRNLC